jgi:hypothetical protein
MSILSSLKLSDVHRPTSVERRQKGMREVVLEGITHQIALIQASEKGQPYTVEREKYIKDGDHSVKTTVKSTPKPWWWQQDGSVFLQVKYGSKTVQVAADKPTIEAGKTLKDAVKVLEVLKQAVEAGELDAAIAQAKEASKRAAA